MIFNPYDASTSLDATDQTDIRSANNAMTIGIKSALIILGMLLYLSNVERDAHFYTTILQNEGFPTNNDSIAVGIAGSVIATVFFMPVALFLIWFGIGRCKRLQILPRFDRFTIGWGVLASVLFVLMLLIESNYLIYSIQRPQHWKTITATALYVGYIYLWWCWTPQIDVIIEDVSTGIDIELHNEEVQSSVNWDTPEQIDAVMNMEDLLYGDDEQVSAIHEFGHIIGCRHPGEPGGDDEYTADEDSLMGLGMELRPIYFAAWAVELSEHLPQNGPYGVGEQP